MKAMKKQKTISSIACVGLLIGVFFLSSCKKETPPPVPITQNNQNPTTQYYVRFKINNVLHTYINSANSGMMNMPPVSPDSCYGNIISGYATANDMQHNGMALTISDPQQVTANVIYTNFTPSASGEQEMQNLAINYIDSSGVSYCSFDQSLFAPLGFVSNGRITITDMTATYVKASFSATLYNINTSQSLTLTDGEVYLPRSH
jgi:hypothetical protein